MPIKLTAGAARAQFADLVNRADIRGERTIVHRRKKPVAAVVPIEDLKRLERLEDEIDLAAARKAMKEKGKSIPWSQVKKELEALNAGWVTPSRCPALRPLKRCDKLPGLTEPESLRP